MPVTLATPSLGTIALDDAPTGGVELRCSGCGWPASALDPAVQFVNFGRQQVFRGAVVDQAAGAAVERIQELRLCSECVIAALLTDPSVMQTARERVAAECELLQRDAKHFLKQEAERRREIRQEERRREQQCQEEQERDEIRAAAAGWRDEFDVTVEAFREARSRALMYSRVAEFDDSPEAKRELEEERDRFEKLRKRLGALSTAGARLRGQCESHSSLAGEYELLRDRLASSPDQAKNGEVAK